MYNVSDSLCFVAFLKMCEEASAMLQGLGQKVFDTQHKTTVWADDTMFRVLIVTLIWHSPKFHSVKGPKGKT